MATSGTRTVVIVGGGSAGAVLAARLTESEDTTVLLVEAGPDYWPDPQPCSVLSADKLGAATGTDWGYRTEPGVIGHPIAAYRGRILGGSSAVNGSVMVRALPSDFERWADSGLQGWSFEQALPFYLKLESTQFGADEWHGRSGPVPVHQLSESEVTPMQRAFIRAALTQGIAASEDFNGPTPAGVGPYPMNRNDGVRVNTAIAYLTAEVRARPNLRIIPDTVVDSVVITDGRATGVRTAEGTQVVGDEVILSAGTYGSAAILQRSGVGPRALLESLGIEVLVDLPVGESVVDHPFYYVAYAAKPEAIGGHSPAIGAKAWIASSHAAEGELDLHLTATHLIDQNASPTGAAFVIAVAMVRPLSRGTVAITGKDPQAAPRIDLNFLAVEQDRQRLLDGIALARSLGKTDPLAAVVDSELAPGADATTTEAIMKSVFETLDTYHHPTSSAPMGAADDPRTVVDNNARVRSVAGLRVIDASILPDVTQAATNPTVIMVAERLADAIVTGTDI